MEIYVMLSGKGGSGKTTLAVHLAVAAELSGKTVALIDCIVSMKTIEKRSIFPA